MFKEESVNHQMFLTKEVVSSAVNIVEGAVTKAYAHKILKRQDMCIVVLDPAVPYSPVVDFKSAVLHTERRWDSQWEHPYDQIALGKAKLTWRTGMPSDEVHRSAPHLLQPGDVLLGGSTVRDGLIVACSGVQPHYDRMIAEWVASTIIAMCIDFRLADKSDTDFFPQLENRYL